MVLQAPVVLIAILLYVFLLTVSQLSLACILPDTLSHRCGNDFFVYKGVSESVFALSQELAATFSGSNRLRMHTDYNKDKGEHILVYPFFRDTLLGSIQKDAAFPLSERPKILRTVAEAVHEMHSQDWVHMDIKPDNILVDWTDDDGDGQKKTVTKVALGDFDLAFHPPPGKRLYLPFPFGNVMWRSPEGQAGKGITAASDVFSLGLVVSDWN